MISCSRRNLLSLPKTLPPYLCTLRALSSSPPPSPPSSLTQLPSLFSSGTVFKTSQEATDFPEGDFLLQKDFISEEEEAALCQEVDKKFKRQKYETQHFDSVIKNYREGNLSNWKDPLSLGVLQRVHSLFSHLSLSFLPVHVLDLHQDGFIDPHVDHLKVANDILFFSLSFFSLLFCFFCFFFRTFMSFE